MAWAEIAAVERPESEYLILELNINGTSREQGIDAYLPEGAPPPAVLVPLGVFAKAMSLAINVNPGDGKATGWFREESNIFELDIARGEVRYGQTTTPIPAKGVEVHVDDIYVSAELLSEWFATKVELDMSELVLTISTESALPFQEADARKRRADLLKPQKASQPVINPADAYFPEYEMFSWPSIMLSNNITYTGGDNSNAFSVVSSEQYNMDLLGFGADINVSRKFDTVGDDGIDSAIATFEKRDPKRGLLGPLDAGKITFGDVSYVSVPLFGGGGRGAGLAISSDPEVGFRYARDEDNYVIDGDAPANWDAELYRNGHFVSFQRTGPEGRYNFTELNLIDGYNRFEVVLYGPEGEKRTITREVFRGASMLKPGETTYDFALGAPQADFLPVVRDARDDYTFGATGQIFHGVNNFITVGGSFASIPDNDGNVDSAATATVIAAARGAALQGQVMTASEGRSAYEATVQAKPFKVNTALSHRVYKGFDVDDQDIEDSTSLSLSRQFGRVDIQVSGEQNNLQGGTKETVLENAVSTNIGSVKFTNELSRTSRNDNTAAVTDGQFTAVTDILDVRLRGGINYMPAAPDGKTLRNVTVSGQKNFSKENSLHIDSAYDFTSGITSVTARNSRKFGIWSVDFSLNGTSDNNYGVGIAIRSGLQPQPKGGYKQVDAVTASQASMGVRAFVDTNDNGTYDAGEKLLENISFRSDRGDSAATTVEDGTGWMSGMLETPTRIFVNKEDIPSIYLVPSKDFLPVIPRRGARPVVDFAFKQLGEIDGYISAALAEGVPDTATEDGEEQFVGDVPVRLVNAETGEVVLETRSESDGYYVFSAVPLGKYKVSATQGWFEGENADVETTEVALTQDVPTALDINFKVAPPPETDDLSDEELELLQKQAECEGTDDECLEKLEKQIGDVLTYRKDAPPAPAGAPVAVAESTPPLPAVTANPPASGYVVQLASFPRMDMAEEEIVTLRQKYAAALEGTDLVIIQSDIEGATYYRIVTKPEKKQAASTRCDAFRAAGKPEGCMVRPSAG